MSDDKNLRNRGLFSMAGTGGRRGGAKKVGQAGPSAGGDLVPLSSWLGMAIEELHTDKSPLWGRIRAHGQGWRPSGMGEQCDRKSVLGMLGYRGEPISLGLRRIFDLGNQVEAQWRQYFSQMGILLSSNQKVFRESDPIVSGEYDVLVKHPYEPTRRLIGEIKSINDNGFSKLPAVTLDPDQNFAALTTLSDRYMASRIRNYVLQLQMYLRLTGTHEGFLLFSNKNDSSYADYYLVQVPGMVEEEFNRLRFRDPYWRRQVVPPCTCLTQNKIGLCVHNSDVEVPLAAMKEISVELGGE